MDFESDEALAAAVERRDRRSARAATELFRRHLPRVYSLCGRFFSIREDVEEAASETFLRAFRGLAAGQYRGTAGYRTWLLRIASNTCIERMRQPRLPTLSLEGLTDSVSEPALRPAHEPSAVLDAIRMLPDDQSLAITLCDLEGYSAKEAAQIMGRSPEALKSLHYRARRAVRDILAKPDQR